MTESKKINIAVAKGDGIGPEIMDSVIKIFDAANAPLNYHYVDMGKDWFNKGFSTGMTPEATETIEEHGVLFKGPMETPKGKGVKSINVTARKVWNTYANVRKFRIYHGVDTVFSQAGIPINMTILRENIEDTYGGIEYMHSPDVAVSYRLITKPGSDQFFKYVFEYAKAQGATQVTCAHKSNIMKLTDGLFMNTFYDVAKQYPEIEVNDLIVDDLAMKLVRFPDKFQIIALTNLQGDIISDLCAGLVGGLGFAPSANIGDNISIFEAVHGTAPDIAGHNIANPTSLLLSGIMMLRHLGQISFADNIENALLYTLENGTHTGDFGAKDSKPVSTTEFADTIIANFGKTPEVGMVKHTGIADFTPVKKSRPSELRILPVTQAPEMKIAGADIFIESYDLPNVVAQQVAKVIGDKVVLQIISNRGTKVWPSNSVFTDSVPHYRMRFVAAEENSHLNYSDIFELATRLSELMIVSDVEVLKEWGDLIGYSKIQGA